MTDATGAEWPHLCGRCSHSARVIGRAEQAARRAVIWPTYHVVSVPAITGVHGTIATEAWIFMKAIVFRERPHLPRFARSEEVIAPP
jgi:hypothetical protein